MCGPLVVEDYLFEELFFMHEHKKGGVFLRTEQVRRYRKMFYFSLSRMLFLVSTANKSVSVLG